MPISDIKAAITSTVKDNKKERKNKGEKEKGYLVNACGDCAFCSRAILAVGQYPLAPSDGFLYLPYLSCKFTVQYLNRKKKKQ